MLSKIYLRAAKRCILLAAALSGTAPAAHAGDDFGIWAGVSAEKSVTKRLSFDVGADFRAGQNLQSIARWDGSLGVDYKVCKFLKVSTGYTYIYDRTPQEAKANFNNKGKRNGYNVEHGFWRSKHRFNLDATGRVKLGRFNISLRERYMLTRYAETDYKRDRYRDAAQPGYVGENFYWGGEAFTSLEQVERQKAPHTRHLLRSRLQAEWKIRGPFTPYVAYELSNDMSQQFELKKTRLSVGTDWKISKKHVLSLGYVYQNGIDDDSSNNIHVIDVGYKFKF